MKDRAPASRRGRLRALAGQLSGRPWRQEARAALRTPVDLVRTLGADVTGTTPRPSPTLVDRAVVRASLQHVGGWIPPGLGPEDVLVTAVVKDAAEHIEAFLDHHLALGARGVVLLDNGSEDETVQLALRYAPVLVLQSKLPFRTYVHAFRSVLRERYGRTCWTLGLDADERFDYPGSERISLARVARHLNAQGANLVLANLLEVFAKGPIQEQPMVRGRQLAELYRFYDATELEPRALDHPPTPPGAQALAHGVRKTAFARSKGYLHKFPLAFFRDGLEPWHLTGHHVRSDFARLGDFTPTLYHLKFTRGLKSSLQRAVEERSHAGDSEKARHYLQVLEAQPTLDLYAAALNPRSLQTTEQLIEDGIMFRSAAYQAMADREARDRKVFCVGFHKTGTTSMGVLLRALGYRVASAYRTRDQAFVSSLAGGDLADLFSVADRANAFEDNPWPLFVAELDDRYPGSRFIMTTRDPDAWIRSLVSHFGRQEDADSPMRAFIYGLDHGDPRGHEARYKARYAAHLAAVRAHFAGRSEDLLEVDVSDADTLKRVCDFLGHPAPVDRMPHANRQSTVG